MNQNTLEEKLLKIAELRKEVKPFLNEYDSNAYPSKLNAIKNLSKEDYYHNFPNDLIPYLTTKELANFKFVKGLTSRGRYR